MKMKKRQKKKDDNNNIDNKGGENKTQEKPSTIQKCNETRTFTEEKRILDILGLNEEEKDKKENNKNFWPKNKNKKGKRPKGTEIKGNFFYD